MAETAWAALLRGVNVGGRNKLAMAELADLFASLGCRSTRTYIQSGNVVFMAGPALAGTLPDVAATAIAQRFGLRVPVVLRSAAELREVVDASPFLSRGCDPGHLHVAFLAHRPPTEAAGRLDPDRSPPDELALLGREVHLHLPRGVARTKLTTDYLDRRLGTTCTVRNWRTVCRLAEMANDLSPG